MLGIQDYFHYLMSAQSDSMLVSVCLAAIDMYLCGRLRWAFWLGVLAGLGRPEVWPFARRVRDLACCASTPTCART